MKYFFEDMKDIFPLLWPVWLLGGIILFVFIWDEYDSYSECMYEWELEKSFAESQWPGQNDWRRVGQSRSTGGHPLRDEFMDA